MGPITQLHFGNCVYYATTLDYRKSQNNYPLLKMQTHFFRGGNYWDHEFREKDQNSRYLPCNFVIKLGEFRLGETIPTKNFWRGQNFQGNYFEGGVISAFTALFLSSPHYWIILVLWTPLWISNYPLYISVPTNFFSIQV